MIFRLRIILRTMMDLGSFYPIFYHTLVELLSWLASFISSFFPASDHLCCNKTNMFYWDCVAPITSNLNCLGVNLICSFRLGLAVQLFPSKFWNLVFHHFALLHLIYLFMLGRSCHTFWGWHRRAATMGSTGDSLPWLQISWNLTSARLLFNLHHILHISSS